MIEFGTSLGIAIRGLFFGLRPRATFLFPVSAAGGTCNFYFFLLIISIWLYRIWLFPILYFLLIIFYLALSDLEKQKYLVFYIRIVFYIFFIRGSFVRGRRDVRFLLLQFLFAERLAAEVHGLVEAFYVPACSKRVAQFLYVVAFAAGNPVYPDRVIIFIAKKFFFISILL